MSLPEIFWTAEDWRAEAEKREHLAKLAERDGDHWHAAEAKAEAARCRQKARMIEVEALAKETTNG
jgi:hypothetical protein